MVTPDPLRVAALTPGVRVPSARFRVGQYVAPLRELGVELHWRPAPVSAYPPERRWLRPFWLPASLAGRVSGLLATRRADVTLFNRELVSTLATLEGLAASPRVFDVDDAIFLRRGGAYAASLARRMDRIIAGNDFLAGWFADHNPEVAVLPTAVDTARFSPAGGDPEPGFVVGWSGTSGNFPFLEAIVPAVAEAMSREPRLRFHVSADRPPSFRGLDSDRVTFVPWTSEGEVDFIRSLDVGLMPLRDDDWARGKCAYKMLLYLACGVPTVTTPVGVNAQLLTAAEVGLPARDLGAWTDAVLALMGDPDARGAMGRRGRDLVEREYSLAALAPRLATLLLETAGRSA